MLRRIYYKFILRYFGEKTLLRRSGAVDGKFYWKIYPDVRRTKHDPVDHYVDFGQHEHRSPRKEFIVWDYIERHPECEGAGITPLTHALIHGNAFRDPARDSVLRGGRVKALKNVDGGKAICLFSHYDAMGRILPYVLFYLRALRNCGVEIHLISTSPKLLRKDRAKAEAIGVKVYMRENTGRDFGSWQWGLRNITGLDREKWFFLANDSVFGPLHDLKPILSRGMTSNLDMWGMTSSFQICWHLQSYFIAIRSPLIHSRAFRKVFEQDFSLMKKSVVIWRGEIELSQAMLREGRSLGALYPYEDLVRPSRVNQNPYVRYWRKLIEKMKFPFFKIQHLREPNPKDAPGITDWRKVIARVSSYDTKMMDAFQTR